ncbi:hypothetical protein N836_13310 [Leptolyngbya sp. Heron Island J]|uniref:hypothetical protein n=1 Tax=Leptolyngbya sp. Heron Island J TaxID=1385935 RepID=UPI0003B9DFC3|nr:hypothetical protein [Leptolyngbya sp. Heron Island J]ESA35171.1 hypothetical protein N836_13310 [Leptolyngbya sp. Heron Island J]
MAMGNKSVEFPRKVIFIELNEVPFKIIDNFIRQNPTSDLALALPKFHQYLTHIDDKVLSPWISWPTLHRGVPAHRHGISNLGENLTLLDQQFPPIWQILSRHGVKTGVLGSLHSSPLPQKPENYAFYLPDSFALSPDCIPAHLSSFQALNLSLASHSARNVSGMVPVRQSLELLTNVRRLGILPSTLVALVRQLGLERLKPYRKNRRRTYQAVLHFDLFFKQLKEIRPDFATCFTNHVASAMHRYWAAAFPEDYQNFGFSSAWVARYRDEIDFALGQFSRFLGRLIHFVQQNPSYMLWITSSMGQSATTANPILRQLYLTQPAKLMGTLGVPDHAWKPQKAMLPITSIWVNTPWRESVRKALNSLTIKGVRVTVDEKADGFFSVHLDNKNLVTSKTTQAVIQGQAYGLLDLGLENVTIEDQSGASAYHIPEGLLLIYDPLTQAVNHRRSCVSVLEIAPTLLELFNISVPDYMLPPSERGRLASDLVTKANQLANQPATVAVS